MFVSFAEQETSKIHSKLCAVVPTLEIKPREQWFREPSCSTPLCRVFFFTPEWNFFTRCLSKSEDFMIFLKHFEHFIFSENFEQLFCEFCLFNFEKILKTPKMMFILGFFATDFGARSAPEKVSLGAKAIKKLWQWVVLQISGCTRIQYRYYSTLLLPQSRFSVAIDIPHT